MQKKQQTQIILTCCQAVARQHDDAVISDADKNLPGPTMYVCAKFGCWTPDGLGAVFGQRNKHTDRYSVAFVYCWKIYYLSNW